jgi:hypothetical protein
VFIEHVKKLVNQGVSSTEISYMYMLYLEKYSDNPQELDQVYITITANHFFDDLRDQAVTFAFIAVHLIQRL